MRIKVPTIDEKSKPVTVVKSVDRFSPFGEMSETFKGQGWIPERWNDATTEYRSKYGMLNSVDLPNQKEKGYLSIKGGNTNGVFDLLIKDAKGNPVQTLLKGVNAKQINDYFTNYNAQDNYGNQVGSPINQRANYIQANPNSILNAVAIRK